MTSHIQRSVLVIAVHPDDETLGCGGTLLKWSAAGEQLHWLIVTAACEPDYTPAQIARQAEQVDAVRRAYPFQTLDWLKFPTTRLDTLPLNTLIGAIRPVFERLHPEIVLVHNRSDVHSDHRIVFQAIASVLKPIHMRELSVRRILAYETLSETEATPPFVENAFLPSVYVDISTTLDGKLKIMELYQTEVQPYPLPRSASSIEALARFRGATIGIQYAESFMLLREVSI